MTQVDNLIDVSGLHCPQPVIMCKAALSRMRAGEILCVVATDRASVRKLPTLIGFLGDEIVSIQSDGHLHRVFVKRRAISGMGRVHRIRDRLAALISGFLSDYTPSPAVRIG